MDVNLQVQPFLMLSGTNVVLSILSVALDAPSGPYTDFQGIWCGIFYLITANLCFFLHFKRQDRIIVILALIFSSLSVLFGFVAAGLSGSNANDILCQIFVFQACKLQWSLMAFSLCAVIVNAGLSYILFLKLQKNQESARNT